MSSGSNSPKGGTCQYPGCLECCLREGLQPELQKRPTHTSKRMTGRSLLSFSVWNIRTPINVCLPANNLMKCACTACNEVDVQQAELNLAMELKQSSWNNCYNWLSLIGSKLEQFLRIQTTDGGGVSRPTTCSELKRIFHYYTQLENLMTEKVLNYILWSHQKRKYFGLAI